MLALRADDPHAAIVLTRNFKAFEWTCSYIDTLGRIAGDVEPADDLLAGPGLVNPNLMNQVNSLPPEDCYSFVFGSSAQVLDHALTRQALDFRVRGLQYARGKVGAAEIPLENGSTALRASDHDGLVL